MKKQLVKITTLLLGLIFLAGCGGTNNDPNILRVGATPVPHARILYLITEDLAAQGIELQIVEFTDFHIVNPALTAGQLDANFFQHRPFMNRYIEETGNELVMITDVHVEPMSAYSETILVIEDVPYGATFAIPGDRVNGGRALVLLETHGLIRLTDGVGINATVFDIVDNPFNITFRELEAALLPAALRDVDAAVINTNFALGAGLNPMYDAFIMEDANSPFANGLVVRPEDADSEAIRLLAAAMNSEKVREYLAYHFPGAIVPTF